jgi:TolA-binding protein
MVRYTECGKVFNAKRVAFLKLCRIKNQCMPATHSAMSLYLRYRLWIAELNFEISILRIFGDYLSERRTQRKETEVKSKIDYFEKQFSKLRSEIDELRHELQLSKMKLGVFAHETKPFDLKSFNKESQSPIKKRLAAYRTDFKKIKNEFEDFVTINN